MTEYLIKVNLGKPGDVKGHTYICSHPLVKETKLFGSCSMNPSNSEMYFNIQCTTIDGVEYRETASVEEIAIKAMEEKLQSLTV